MISSSFLLSIYLAAPGGKCLHNNMFRFCHFFNFVYHYSFSLFYSYPLIHILFIHFHHSFSFTHIHYSYSFILTHSIYILFVFIFLFHLGLTRFPPEVKLDWSVVLEAGGRGGEGGGGVRGAYIIKPRWWLGIEELCLSLNFIPQLFHVTWAVY